MRNWITLYRAICSVLLMAMLTSSGAAANEPGISHPGGSAALISALRQGGHVVFLRHATTDRTQTDGGDLANRGGQRNLSATGQAQAAALGRALIKLRLPIGEVLTSPVFRARDTADLVFGTGRASIIAELTADDYEPDPGRVQANVAWIRKRVSTTPAAGNDVLVGHIVPLSMVLRRPLTNRSYPEATLAVFSPTAGQAELLGFLTADDLSSAAGDVRRLP